MADTFNRCLPRYRYCIGITLLPFAHYCPRRQCMQVAGGRIFLLIIRDSGAHDYRTPIALPENHKGDLMIYNRHVLWTAILAMWFLLFTPARPATAQELFYQ